MQKLTLHLIPNAHLDPVWLWDWREGLNEGLVTCRTILDLMDEDEDLTFIRGETAVYQHIERTDPVTFARIRKHVRSGRWDPVGGTVIQPDTNLPEAETFLRHFTYGQQYLKNRFGKYARVAWAADSFGHAAGLPEILRASGIDYYAFTRPGSSILPIASPAFWWEGPGGARILAYRPTVGWYGCERDELPRRLDAIIDAASNGSLANVACFFGLGNHGGGPTRLHIEQVREWSAAHREVKVIFSGLHRFFDALHREVRSKRKVLPVHRGEMNFVLRGCYSSVAKFKFLYRRTENVLQRVERAVALVGLGNEFEENSNLVRAWDGLLFNSFHDILPGSSIERAFDDQLAWLGGCLHAAQQEEFAALNSLAARIDTTVREPESPEMPSGVAMLVWNPHPQPYCGLIELEASLDYRPIWKYHKRGDALPVRVTGADGKNLSFQPIETENHTIVDLPWRKRVLVPLEVPALGWSVIEMAYDETATPVKSPTTSVRSGDREISNGIYTVRAEIGAAGIQLFRCGVPIFGEAGLGAVTVEDPWGSWGGMAEEPESLHLNTVRHRWKITDARVLESGPFRALMWAKLEAGNSRLELACSVSHDRACVDVGARVLWNERSARLKLLLPCGDRATYQVPGAVVQRDSGLGEVPGGSWVRIRRVQGSVGFASDSLYNFDASEGEFRATICRASRYGDDVHTLPDQEPWRAAVDAGELKFRFLITDGENPDLPLLARQLEQPPVTMLVPPHPGKLGRTGSLGSLSPSTLRILALKRAEDGKGIILRVQETSGNDVLPKLSLMGNPVRLPKVRANRISSWRLSYRAKKLHATPTDAREA